MNLCNIDAKLVMPRAQGCINFTSFRKKNHWNFYEIRIICIHIHFLTLTELKKNSSQSMKTTDVIESYNLEMYTRQSLAFQ